VKVGGEGFCIIVFLDDKSLLKIRESSQLQFMETANTRTVNIEFGKILADVKKDKSKGFRIETPVSVASVKGTQFWTVSNQMGFDKFYGLEGDVEVFNS
ncbi:MAG: FecR family protein, partial [Candidatus Thermoplasmatota archaeon]|nr:FecR family protein [Candidatus Thermoplasmatota archaeon]